MVNGGSPLDPVGTREVALHLLQLLLEFLHHQPQVAEAGLRQRLYPQLHGGLPFSCLVVRAEFGASEADSKGKLFDGLTQLHR